MGKYFCLGIKDNFCGDESLKKINNDLINNYNCPSLYETFPCVFGTLEAAQDDADWLNYDAEGLKSYPQMPRPITAMRLIKADPLNHKLGFIQIKLSGGMNMIEVRAALSLARWAQNNKDSVDRKVSDNYDWKTVRQYCDPYEEKLKTEFDISFTDYKDLPQIRAEDRTREPGTPQSADLSKAEIYKSNCKVLLDETTDNYRLYSHRRLDLAATENNPIWGDGFIKTENGLRHFAGWFPEGFGRENLFRELNAAKQFTARPYILGGACDGTIDECVWALFLNFCECFGYSAKNLYEMTYGGDGDDFEEFDTERQSSVRKRGEWQGVTYPGIWNQTALAGLCKSLNEINARSMWDVVTQLPEFLGYDPMTGRFTDIR